MLSNKKYINREIGIGTQTNYLFKVFALSSRNTVTNTSVGNIFVGVTIEPTDIVKTVLQS